MKFWKQLGKTEKVILIMSSLLLVGLLIYPFLDRKNLLLGIAQNYFSDLFLLLIVGYYIEQRKLSIEKEEIRTMIFRGIKTELEGDLHAIANNKELFQKENGIGSFVVKGFWEAVINSKGVNWLFNDTSRLNELVILYERIRIAQIHEENFVAFLYQVPRFPRGRRVKGKQMEKFKHDILALYRDIEIDAEKILNLPEFKKISPDDLPGDTKIHESK